MNKIPKTMKGIQLIGHGGNEMNRYSESIAVPSPQKNEVLIKVMAAGVNNTDINTRIGWYSKGDNDSEDATWSGDALSFPRVQGADVCGVIVAVGEDTDASRIGERVIIEPSMTHARGQELGSTWYFGSECDGGFAEYTAVDSRHAFRVNSDMTDVELASFPCSYSTAENMLTRAKVVEADTVLVSGASGGVGSAAVQLAKARGAKVIAIVGARKKEEMLKLGADQVVVRGDDLVAELGTNSVTVVIDLVAGEQWPDFLEVLKPKGRYAVSGAIGGAMVELDVRTLYLKDLSFFGCTVLEPEVFSNLVKVIEQRKIKPLVAQIFALNEINEAQATFLKKKHIGKLVLKINRVN
ncbi:alcohol dehydrogenase family protein [Vibrio sp. SCSIO 43169]|uniref:alcohol dehydrogenase family protein n=1 Tax=Vibrio sp. SCSIO 43169 TaxID=2822801 RepID=UPI0020447320|nr:alcohol dehydrogenase family protein [Vibrio sp. SCSIO 43169]MCM5511087.1 alcohol dehydrogenase family protein [Vibrio sp. SCSIO 43169]